MTEFLKHHLWAVFLAHQMLILTLAVAFLTLIRRITGRTIHGGRDPVGVSDGAALVALSVGVMLITWALYRRVKSPGALPLGIAPSPRRFIDLIAGLLIGFAFIIRPYIHALLRAQQPSMIGSADISVISRRQASSVSRSSCCSCRA